MADVPLIVVPGDAPRQIGGSAALERLAAYGEVEVHDTRPTDDGEKIERAREATVIINSRGAVRWGAADFARLPKLKMMTTCSIGSDSIDIAAAKARGITVCNIPDRTVPMVAEHLFAMMLAAAKQLPHETAEIRAGRWNVCSNIYLRGKTLGIVGTGNVGTELARLAQAIGMEVIAWTFNPSPERAAELGVTFVAMEELLDRSDVVSLNVKLTPETEGLIGVPELARMKDQAILLNGARGAVVDMDALCTTLAAGRLFAVALDVFPQEPLPADAPILAFDRVVLTPHAADQTPEAVTGINEGAVENVIAFLDGRPQNLVEP
jgi:D-3-phosphoglycerate dehydrogenase